MLNACQTTWHGYCLARCVPTTYTYITYNTYIAYITHTYLHYTHPPTLPTVHTRTHLTYTRLPYPHLPTGTHIAHTCLPCLPLTTCTYMHLPWHTHTYIGAKVCQAPTPPYSGANVGWCRRSPPREITPNFLIPCTVTSLTLTFIPSN